MGPFWSKIKIQNFSTSSKKVILYNLLPGTNYIDVYIYRDDKVFKKYLLGDMRPQITQELNTRYHMFELTLEAKESFTIISKVDNYNINNISWIISQYNRYITLESKKLIIYGLAGGFLFLFSILSFGAFSIYKESTYFLLGIFSLNYLFYHFSFQGVFYLMDIGINLDLLTYYAWSSPNIGSIMLLIFTYKYFNMKINYKKYSYATLVMIAIHIVIISLMTYAFLVNERYFNFSFLIGLSVMTNAIFLVTVGIYMKEIGSKSFLIGQMILIFSVILATLGVYGVITYKPIYRDMIHLSFVIDVVFLLIAQALKTKHRIDMIKTSKAALIETSRFSSMGTAINDISHQWKHPLSHIGLSITLLKTILQFKKEELETHVETELPKISYSLNLMKKTMDEFSTYYSQKLQKESFLLKSTVVHVSSILKAKIILKNAKVDIDIRDDLKINSYEHIYSNIIMILIDNSLDAFEEDSKNNNIDISISKNKDSIEIIYKDNAGGIKIKPIEKVFDYFVSTKDDNDTNEKNGSGLAILKDLVEERLFGNVYLKNLNDGVEFKIILYV